MHGRHNEIRCCVNLIILCIEHSKNFNEKTVHVKQDISVTVVMHPPVSLLSRIPLCHYCHASPCVTIVTHPPVSLLSCIPLCHYCHASPCVTIVMHPCVSLLSYTPLCHYCHASPCVTIGTHPPVSLLSHIPLCHYCHAPLCVTVVIHPSVSLCVDLSHAGGYLEIGLFTEVLSVCGRGVFHGTLIL